MRRRRQAEEPLDIVVGAPAGARFRLRYVAWSCAALLVWGTLACLLKTSRPELAQALHKGLLCSWLAALLLAGRYGPPWKCTVWTEGPELRMVGGRAVPTGAPVVGIVIRGLGDVPQRRVRLSSIRSVELADGTAVVGLENGRIQLDAGCPDSLQVARRVAEAAGQPLALPTGASLDEQAVAGLLGIESSDGIEVPVHGPHPRWFALYLLAAFFLAVLVLRAAGAAAGGALSLRLCTLTAVCLGLVQWMAEQMPNSWRALRAEAAGVVFRQRAFTTTYPWPDIHSLEPDRRGWRLRTFVGDLTIPRRGAEPVLAAIRKVLQAREAGAVLPRLGFVGDAAISPVRDGEARAERGISHEDR